MHAKAGDVDKPVVWLQISAGQGPRECAWVAGQVLRHMLQEARGRDLLMELIEMTCAGQHKVQSPLEAVDAVQSALIRLEGESAPAYAGSWVGTVKWHGKSPYRHGHKRRNWFVGVEKVTFDPPAATAMADLANEVSMAVLRSRGPGGQHVNKTNSGVRITHGPTGMQVRVDTDRSQHRNRQQATGNRQLALERLHMLLKTGAEDNAQQQNRDRWRLHYQVHRGNPVRTFTGLSFAEERQGVLT